MSRKVLLALVVVMVVALAFSNAEPVKAEFDVKGEVKGETVSRIVRSPGDGKKKLTCADKKCVTACVLRNGNPECV